MRTWLWLAIMPLMLQVPGAWGQQTIVPDPRWEVARAQFTSGIRDREPIDRLLIAGPKVNKVYFFTDLRHLEGRTVTHQWKYKGQVVSQLSFEVRGPRWRVNSKIEIAPDQVGEWTVTVLDQSGWPLYTEMFRYENGPALLQPLSPEDNAAGGAAAGSAPAAPTPQGPDASVPEPPSAGSDSSD